MLILPCREVAVSRNSSGGAGRMNVLEGDRLSPSEETAPRCRAWRTGESDWPLKGIIRPALEGVGSLHDGKSCTLDCLDVGL
jgi:hypothetical protein